jgi:hypothetical protein
LEIQNKKNLVENEKSARGKISSLSKNQFTNIQQSPEKNKLNLKSKN